MRRKIIGEFDPESFPYPEPEILRFDNMMFPPAPGSDPAFQFVGGVDWAEPGKDRSRLAMTRDGLLFYPDAHMRLNCKTCPTCNTAMAAPDITGDSYLEFPGAVGHVCQLCGYENGLAQLAHVFRKYRNQK